MLQHLRIHTLVWQNADVFAAERRDEVDPEGVAPRTAHAAERGRIEAELPAYLEGAGGEGVGFGGGEALGIFFDDEG